MALFGRLLIAGLLGSLGCAPGAAVIDVEVTGALDGLETLQVTVLQGDVAPWGSRRQEGGPRRVRVQLPPGVSGTLRLRADALGGAGCELARGEASVSVEGNTATPAKLTIPLDPFRGCALTIASPQGIFRGGGEVTLRPAPRDLTCAPSCGASYEERGGAGVLRLTSDPGTCTPLCTGYYDQSAAPESHRVTLAVKPDADSYFAGWARAGGCVGEGGCELEVGAGQHGVEVPLLPKQLCEQGWCWENPAPLGGLLSGGFARTARDVWVVGEGGIILRWNGSYWARYGSGTSAALSAVFARSADDVWVVGNEATALHFDGHGFMQVEGVPPIALQAVWGDGQSVWMASQDGTVLRHDGAQLEVETRRAGAQLFALWGTGADNLWAAGDVTLRRGPDGWSRQPGAPPAQVHGLWGFPGQFPWGVGHDRTDLSKGFIGQLSETGWTKVQKQTIAPQAIWGSGADDLWVVGAGGAVLRGDGTRFVAQRTGRRALLASVFGTGDRDVWLIGDGGGVLHWNGALWSSGDTLSDTTLLGVYGHRPDAMWAIGGTLLKDGVPASSCSVLRRDGARWREELCPGQQPLGDVWGFEGASGSSAVLIANGALPPLLSIDDGPLQLIEPPPPGGLNVLSVWAATPRRLWFAGSNGRVERYEASAYHAEAGAAPYHILRIRGRVTEAGAEDVWALGTAGDRGAVLRRVGASWQVVDERQASLTDLWVSAAGDVWICHDADNAARAGVLHLAGEPPRVVKDYPLGAILPYAVWGRDPGELWIAGGSIARFDPAADKFIAVPGATAGTFTRLWGVQDHLFAVGGGGAILHRRPVTAGAAR